MTDTDSADRLTPASRKRRDANMRPRDAGSLIVVDTEGGAPRVLLGRRHPGQAFLPEKYVFPGGRVELADSRLRVGKDLSEPVCAKLLAHMKGRPSPARARALALAAVRETFEETGLVIGEAASDCPETRSPAWKAFFAHGVVPRLDRLTFLARAVTPPRRSRRYDTRFFVVDAADVVKQVGQGDGEFTDVQWVTFEEARLLELPAMTRTILDDFAASLDHTFRMRNDHEIPFYFTRNGLFVRERIRGDR